MVDSWLVQPYRAEDEPEWNMFIRHSRNGVFLFEREYMDYHAERFQDASVMIRDRDSGRLMAVLPLHRVQEVAGVKVVSHGGLTFGGLVMDPKLGGAQVLEIFQALLAFWRAQGVSQLIYRPVPHIYHRLPSEDDLYALYRLGAKLNGMQLSSTLDLTRDFPSSSARKRIKARAARAGVMIEPISMLVFWPTLENTLSRRHGVKPVHSVGEISLLSSRFEQIESLGARSETGELLAGTVLYHYEGVTHTQYLAASEGGYEVGAMNALMESCIEMAREKGQRWFSFGTSSYDGGRGLNAGLLRHKEQFGARSTVLQSYELSIGE